ncbi:hypothetical protein G7076_05225 [Sphingomonas sp. HDW15A]|uniref:hypothetical protein n=1 Tax=Sphingomonas sp. HDW15A TaxID=2714942 RepID=UPI001407FB77|nr:hypothetical protein [Sphingomonas sp. HDW15A]QIK95950.1 hypothetical protein G7076_05225 [Sphingomonas sp. HDW15A]
MAFGYAIERPRLHLALRADGVAFLQKLVEGGADALANGVLKWLRQIVEGGVAMDCLDVAKQLVGQPARPGLQCLDRFDDCVDQHVLHNVGSGFQHVCSPWSAVQ